jgi:signal transduction histidine kinase
MGANATAMSILASPVEHRTVGGVGGSTRGWRSRRGRPQYCPDMADETRRDASLPDAGEPDAGDPDAGDPDVAPTTARTDPVRVVIPIFALIVIGLAVLTEPADWWQPLVLLGAAGLFAAWARWDIPVWILTAGVLTAVILAELDPELEPATFLVCLLAIAVSRWEPIGAVSIAALVAMIVTPVVINSQRGDDYGWAIWTIAITFSIAIGWALRRQDELTLELARARVQLARATMQEERRRIARDVHDLVGHGLAAMMVHVTGARHVLTRDPKAAAEALETAEEVGRQSMQELRRTVALLRSDSEGDSGLDEPLPKLTQLGNLVDAARERGLDVEYHAEGAHEAVDPAIGLTLHRIAQEALANAGRHAPHARTVVRIVVTDDAVTLDVDSVGAVAAPPTDGAPHFGLQGMRERADVVGGEFEAGPSANGWTVHCRVPRAADR